MQIEFYRRVIFISFVCNKRKFVINSLSKFIFLPNTHLAIILASPDTLPELPPSLTFSLALPIQF